MNFSKRAFISVVRRKTNSLILLLIVFILANVLLQPFLLRQHLRTHDNQFYHR